VGGSKALSGSQDPFEVGCSEILHRAIQALTTVGGQLDVMPDAASFFRALTAASAHLVCARVVVFWLSEGVDVLVPQPDAHGMEAGLLARLHLLSRPSDTARFEDRVRTLLRAESVIAAPWRVGERRLGMVAAIDSNRPGGFGESDATALRAAGLAAGALWRQKQLEWQLEATIERLGIVEQERRMLHHRIGTAVEEDRKRIADEVHDDSLQMLAAVQLRIEQVRRSLGQPGQRELLETLATTVEQSMASMRRLIFDLRPPALDVDGLAAALQLYIDQLCAGTGTTYRLESRLVTEPGSSTRGLLYRICREALTNAWKHSRARSVRVILDEVNGGIRALVEDDGAGFGEAAPPSSAHLGLAIMRERAELAGGWLLVTSGPGAGTTVDCWIPGQ
jgi:signal transduction histidine kinase